MIDLELACGPWTSSISNTDGVLDIQILRLHPRLAESVSVVLLRVTVVQNTCSQEDNIWREIKHKPLKWAKRWTHAFQVIPKQPRIWHQTYFDIKTVCQPRENFIKTVVCLPNMPYFFVRSTPSPSGNFWHLLHPHCLHVVIKESLLSYMSHPLALFITLLGRSLYFGEYSLIMKNSSVIHDL